MVLSARTLVSVLGLLGSAFPGADLAWAAAPGEPIGNPSAVREFKAATGASRAEAARRSYLDAAERTPEVAEWLILRAASVSPDSAVRAGFYARIRVPVVRARILAVEAAVREQAGDLAGAALRYDSLGEFGESSRLRLKLAWTQDQRAALREGLIAVIRQRPGRPEAQQALDYLALTSVALPPQQALDAARLATQSGAVAAAAALYARAVAGRVASPADLLAYGTALAAVRKYRDAIKVFTRLRADTLLRTEATYRLAWSQARVGRASQAAPVLDQLLAMAPDDSLIRPRALFLAGSLAWQRGDQIGARLRWGELFQRYPHADSAARGGFLAAMMLYEEGRTSDAGAQWERVHLLDGGSDGLAAGYWAGRAWSEVGDSRRATGLWQSVIARDASSYYGVLSARRLNVASWRPAPVSDQFARYADVDSAMTRVQVLRALDMSEEAGYEVSWLTGDRERSPERALAIGDAFRRAGDPVAAIASARRALLVGAAPDARTYRLLYPRHFEDHLEIHAAAAGLDPFLVAALIRQESVWQPRARSRVGALGLMQVMPATGRLIARSLRVRGWSSSQLLEPATNLRFGTYYLSLSLLRYGGDLPRALAAYNAGANRTGPWATGLAARDSELFVERISLRETRDYVRTIERNLALYRALYGG
jgi:soluble lytic murein transglycosylase